MNLTIHRGSHEIGGTCVELVASDGSRILLDIGMPLAAPDGEPWPAGTASRPTRELVAEGVLPDVAGLYADEAPGIEAILISHAHLDHHGLAHHAHPDIPVYATAGTLALLDVNRVFLPDARRVAAARELAVYESLDMGPFEVTAFPVDHSSPAACALLVEADGARLFYSGDLRAHGRTAALTERLIDRPPEDVDVLLLEGTMLGVDAGGRFPTEGAVEEELVHLLKQRPDDLMAVIASGQTVDRLVSVFRAAKRTGRQLVIDPYQAYVLHRLQILSKNLPQYGWPDVRVHFVHNHVEKLQAAGLEKLVWDMGRHAKVETTELQGSPGRFALVARSNDATRRLLDKMPDGRVQVVWAMWRGYWDRDCNVRAFCDARGVTPQFVHSGGHAPAADLKRLADALRPGRIVPIHTTAPDAYESLGWPVEVAQDGVAIEVVAAGS